LSDLFALLVQIVSVVALWAIVGELFRRGLTALAKKSGAGKQLVRNIRDGVRIAWIVVAVAAVLIVTGIASEFQALTVTGLAGLTISLALQTTLSNIIAGVLLFSDKTLRLNDVISYSGIKGTVVQGGSEVDSDQNSGGKHCDNRQQHTDEWTLHQLLGRRTSRRKTLRLVSRKGRVEDH
jgi:small-conductance mechanosensitive channel